MSKTYLVYVSVTAMDEESAREQVYRACRNVGSLQVKDRGQVRSLPKVPRCGKCGRELRYSRKEGICHPKPDWCNSSAGGP